MCVVDSLILFHSRTKLALIMRHVDTCLTRQDEFTHLPRGFSRFLSLFSVVRKTHSKKYIKSKSFSRFFFFAATRELLRKKYTVFEDFPRESKIMISHKIQLWISARTQWRIWVVSLLFRGAKDEGWCGKTLMWSENKKTFAGCVLFAAVCDVFLF